jgi:outer membrane lipoprotein SlyB
MKEKKTVAEHVGGTIGGGLLGGIFGALASRESRQYMTGVGLRAGTATGERLARDISKLVKEKK